MNNNNAKNFKRLIVYLAGVENINFRFEKPVGAIVTPKDESIPIQLDTKELNNLGFNVSKNKNNDNEIILSPQFLSQ